ncbi:MAG: hypothetical protein LBD11_03310 [Candidatus Peribacteria bacterium]|jgi:hypothetical protein|nr:hypothetical protein [Candidatus Peribacteria bacterium]
MKKSLWILGAGLFLLAGCGSTTQQLKLESNDYQMLYQGQVSLVAQTVPTDTSDELLTVYAETGAESSYQDSLLLVEKYNQGKGVLLFSQEAIDVLKGKGLTLENEHDEKFAVPCEGEKKAAHLVAYVVTSGFVQKVPQKLYMTQLFVEKDENTITIWSHSTESKNEQNALRSAFKTLQCK